MYGIIRGLEVQNSFGSKRSGISTYDELNEYEDGSDTAIVNDLMRFGMTTNQARIYLKLLGSPPLTAREISKLTSMHRVDVYRNLNELLDYGVIEMNIGNPKRFIARSPESVIESLLGLGESKISYLKKHSSRLTQRLLQIQRLNQTSKLNWKMEPERGQYRYGEGWKNYINEVKIIVSGAQRELKCITSAHGFIRGRVHELHSLLLKVHKKGVKVRIITSITEQNLSYAKLLAKTIQVRHMDNLNFRMLICDDSITVMSAKMDSDETLSPRNCSYLIFEDKHLAQVNSFTFEQMWNNAVDIRERLAQLRKRNN
jgi:sugar-specific transcriptional regulator TrmB